MFPPLDLVPGTDDLDTVARKVESWANIVSAASNTSTVATAYGVVKTHLDGTGAVTFKHGLKGTPDGVIVTPNYPGYAIAIAYVVDTPGSGACRAEFHGLLYTPGLTYYAMSNEYVEFSWHAFILRK